MKENSIVSKQMTKQWKPAVYDVNAGEKRSDNTVSKNEESNFGPREYGIFGATFFILFASVFGVYMLQPDFDALRFQRLDSIGGTFLIVLGIFLAAIAVSFLIFLIVLHRKYKPIASVSDDELPTCTIIVPAYNEGQLVYDTLHSLASSDYPEKKLQIIAIDDGSKDNTFAWIQRAKMELGDRVEIYQQPKNMGKRHALYRGFKLGTGEIFITVDSDSIVKKDTIRNMASPFVTNKECGAVAGNVRVLNNKKAIIPRMLNVSFVFSFEFVRSAQSMLGTVMCTPGALSGYRKEAVMNCLEDWINRLISVKIVR
jgi:hyaluronan synthase